MSNSHSHRGPSIDASYHVLVHLVKLFHSRRFLPMAAISVNGSRRNEQFLQRTSHRCILPNFSSFGKVVSEEKIFQKSTNQKQELSVAAMFVNGSGRNQQWQQRTFHRCFLPSFGSFGQTVSEEKNLKNQPIRNKNRLWRPCLLKDRDGIIHLYRGPSIDASYQVSVHLDTGFQRRRFLEIDQSETRIACGGHFCLWIGTK